MRTASGGPDVTPSVPDFSCDIITKVGALVTDAGLLDQPTEIYSQFSDLLSGFVFETDANFRIVRCAGQFPHDRFSPLYSAVGCSLLDLALSLPDVASRRRLVGMLKRHQRISRLRYHLGAESHYRCYEFSAAPVMEAGRFRGCRGIIVDATTEQSAQAAIEADHRAAAIADQARTEFLATISHELRTPLNAIIGFSELITGEILGPLGDDRYRDYAGDILSSGRHLLELINEMLDISRLETGKLALKEEEIRLKHFLPQCVRAVEPAFREKGIFPTLQLQADMPAIWADPQAVRQMLAHLLSNAQKFVETGGRVTLSSATGADGSLHIALTDTGVGIAPELIDEVLIPFVHGHPMIARRHGGGGLGLPITKALVELHGGRLELKSVPGQGTCATLVFPPERVLHSSSTRERRAG
jgi:signal transduction histidine kinase